MKSAGLSSVNRNMLKKTTKISVFSSLQENHLAAKEKQRALRSQAAQAQFARQKKESELQAKVANAEATPHRPKT